MPRHGPKGNPHKLPAKANPTAKKRAFGKRGTGKPKKR